MSDDEIQASVSEIEDDLLENGVQSDVEGFEFDFQCPMGFQLEKTHQLEAHLTLKMCQKLIPKLLKVLFLVCRVVLSCHSCFMGCWTWNLYTHISFTEIMSYPRKKKPLGRRSFMKKLSIRLMIAWIETRQQRLLCRRIRNKKMVLCYQKDMSVFPRNK